MDLEQALQKVKELEETVSKLSKVDEANTLLNTQLQEANNKLRERGEQFKKLRDMTDEEKKSLSEKEKDLLTRQEMLEQQQEDLKKKQDDFMKTQSESAIQAAINTHAKGNAELAEKIRFNFDKKLGSVEAKNSEEINKKVFDAFAMVKQEVPDLVNLAINSGGDAGQGGNGGYGETEAGRGLGKMLGLSAFQPKADGDDKK